MLKLEVDINDRAALERLEKELSASLDNVRTLLKQHGSTPMAPQNNGHAGSQENLSDAFIRDFVAKSVGSFTSSEIFIQSAASNISRGEVRGAIARAAKMGVLKVIDPGRGRRPSVYEKK